VHVSGSIQDIRVRGTLRAEEGTGVVRIEMLVPSPANQVWAAFTDRDRLAQWLGEVEGDLHAGGEYRARFFPSGWDGAGRILECDPGRRFLVESAEPGRRTTTDEIELVPEGTDRTRVVVTKRGAPLPMIGAFAVGVQIHVENLAAVLAGRAPVDPDPFWEQLLPQYEQLSAAL
jgi:uncharacterized protein YndB with AHSA1/START domain